MNRIKEVLDKWTLFMDDEQSMKAFRGDIVELLLNIQIDPAYQDDLHEIILQNENDEYFKDDDYPEGET